MDLTKLTGRLDRARFQLVHDDTVFVQGLCGELDFEEAFNGTMAYPPCWAVLDPGMTLDPHRHECPELYVFTNGRGRMRLGDRWFEVGKDLAVFIPPNELHSAENDGSAEEPLVWISIGVKP